MTITTTLTVNNETKTILKLNNKKRISWDSKVIDNEHLNKKKSKCCCQHPSKSLTFPVHLLKLKKNTRGTERIKNNKIIDNYNYSNL